jgi:hypothetical protein
VETRVLYLYKNQPEINYKHIVVTRGDRKTAYLFRLVHKMQRIKEPMSKGKQPDIGSFLSISFFRITSNTNIHAELLD